MDRRTMYAISLAVASVFASEAVYAAPMSIHAPVQAMFGKTKLVTFHLRNDSTAPMKLKAGDSAMTIEAGKSVEVKLPVGARVVADEDSPTHKTGQLIAEVSSSLDGATIGMK